MKISLNWLKTFINISKSAKEIEDILLTYKIDKRFIGEEYKTKEFTGKQLCVDNDIELYYNKRQHSFSTTNLRTRIVEAGK